MATQLITLVTLHTFSLKKVIVSKHFCGEIEDDCPKPSTFTAMKCWICCRGMLGVRFKGQMWASSTRTQSHYCNVNEANNKCISSVHLQADVLI